MTVLAAFAVGYTFALVEERLWFAAGYVAAEVDDLMCRLPSRLARKFKGAK